MRFRNKIVAGVTFIATLAATLTTIQAAPLYKVTALDISLFGTNNNYGYAFGINEAGETMGRVYSGNGSQSQAVIWDATGKIIDHPSQPFTSPNTNNLGQVAGSIYTNNGERATITEANGTVRQLDATGFNARTIARAINNNGIAVGDGYSSFTPTSWTALMWNAEGQLSQLASPTQPYTGPFVPIALDINDNNQIIGSWNVFVGGAAGAILWEDSHAYNLIDVIDPNDASLAYGLRLTEALGINNLGSIVVNGVYGDKITPLLLTRINAPTNDVPEPATVALMGVALMGAPLLRRKRRGETAQKA